MNATGAPKPGALHVAIVTEVRRRLARIGMPQRALAEAIGMSPSSLSARFAGRVSLGVDEVHYIAEALGIDLFDLSRSISNREPSP